MNYLYDYNVAIDAGLFNMLYISDINQSEYVLKKTKEQADVFLIYINEYIKYQNQFNNIFTPGEMQDILNLKEMYEETYIDIVSNICSLIEQRQKDEALSVYINQFVSAFGTFSYYISAAFNKNLDYSLAQTERNNLNANINAAIVIALILLSLIMSIILALEVTKSISIPISNLEKTTKLLAKGEYNVKFEASDSDDEIAILSRRLNGSLHFIIHAQQLKLDALTAQHEKEKAEASSKAKDDFLAKMSHEIRTPMNAITGMAELLLRGELSDTARLYAQDIRQASNNLVAIINDVLDFSKIESGKMDIIPVRYHLSSLINDTINIIRIRLMEKQIQFVLDVDKSIPNNLIGDEVRIRQILINLLSNAVKYTDQGQIKLSIKIKEITEKQIWLIASVSDTGKGIKPEDRIKLFGDFVRVDTKENQGIEGTGLGLAIAKRLCVAMGGDITVESEYGKGSTFTVVVLQNINIKGNELYPDDSNLLINGHDNYFTIRFKLPSVRILVVDDISANLKVAEGLLSPYDAVVDTCLSGEEAIEMIKDKTYDLVFMDHMMPEMNGIEAVTQIRARERKPKLPIIALTANAVSGMKEMFLEKGFDDFLAKPIDILKLEEILDRWIPAKKKEQSAENKKHKIITDEKIPDIPGIDVKRGIINTGGTLGKYSMVLSVFCKDAADRLPVLQTMPVTSTLTAFTTYIHAVKSSLATIGAKEISEKAAELEKAGKKKDLPFIEKNLPLFIEQLKNLIKNIYATLELLKTDNENAINSLLSAPCLALFKELAKTLKARDASEIERIMEELGNMPKDSKTKKAFEQIAGEILMTEYKNALQIIDRLINNK
jgi:signal transduction histidine kinase/CheY-like chemotaxis protein/HPt (histidine-containing phosphotransfer) domain-containing protein